MMFTEQVVYGLPYMTAPNIETAHAFTTRFGGVSGGVYETLNLGQNLGDDPECVKENYRRLCNALGISEADIVCQRQVHGADVRVVTDTDRGKLYSVTDNEGDGLITASPDVALTVFTADCAAILLYDAVCGVIGAVHAGWRGTAADIAGAAVRKMAGEFGCTDIKAAVGPCISKCCFETDSDVADALYGALGTQADKCLERRGDKFMVDIKEANRLTLIRAGLKAGNIAISDECTFCRSDKYWSHRRTKGIRGTQAAIISCPRMI